MANLQISEKTVACVKKTLEEFPIGTKIIDRESFNPYVIIGIEYCSPVEVYFACRQLDSDHGIRIYNVLSGSIMSIDESTRFLKNLNETADWINKKTGFLDVANSLDINWKAFKLCASLEIVEDKNNDVRTG